MPAKDNDGDTIMHMATRDKQVEVAIIVAVNKSCVKLDSFTCSFFMVVIHSPR